MVAYDTEKHILETNLHCYLCKIM